MEEVWKDIVGYEDVYQISNYGRLKRKKRLTVRVVNGKPRSYPMTEIIIKPSLKREGYLKYALNRDLKSKNDYAHRLVANHFIPKPKDYNEVVYIVNHIDGDKSNNIVNNLEWVTYSENNLHAIHVLNKKLNTSGINPPRKVQQIDLHTGNVIKEFETMSLAKKETGACHISSVCRGLRKHAGGFFWKYS